MENATTLRHLYLDLVKRSLTRTIYREPELVAAESRNPLKNLVLRALAARDLRLARPRAFNLRTRELGHEWPCRAHTMIGVERLSHIQTCLEDVLARGVPGDVIEAGAWRGGATILMRAVLKAYGVSDRIVWVADSFEGLPAPDSARYPQDAGDDTQGQLVVTLEEVKTNFESYALLDQQVKFLKGWFRDTLPGAPIGKLAVMRLDGDMYQSTMDALNALYPKLSLGGYIIVDDYFLIDQTRSAVDEYRQVHGITDAMMRVDAQAGYWQRSSCESCSR